MTMQRWDKEQELLDAVEAQIRALLDEVHSVHPAKIARLRSTLDSIRKVLTEEIEYCRKDYFPGAYG